MQELDDAEKAVILTKAQLKSCQGMVGYFKKHRMDMLAKFAAFDMNAEEANQKSRAICEKLKCC